MKLKATGVFPLIAVFLYFSSAFCEKVVEVVVPITKVHSLPIATSETKGHVYKGERFAVDGESGVWYRISYKNTKAWVAKESAKPVEPGTHAAVPGAGQSSGFSSDGLSSDGFSTTGHPHTAPAPGASLAESAATTAKPAESVQTAHPAAVAPAPAAPVTPAVREPGATPPVAVAPAIPIARRPVRPPTPATPGEKGYQFSNMPQLPSGSSEKEQIQYFQVKEKETPVYSVSNDSAIILAKANKGDFFPLIESTESWCRIAFNDTTGWVERSRGAIVNTPSSGAIDEALLIGAIAAALVILALFILLMIRRKSKARTQQAAQFHAVIIGKSPPPVQCVISNKTISLEKYLSMIGFTVKTAHDVAATPKAVSQQQLDVTFIDWNISEDIPGAVELMFAETGAAKPPLAIFYNVPANAEAPLVPFMLRTFLLGGTFTDHEISKLIMPTMLAKSGQRAVAAGAALEGEIAEGNLMEILQFIESGKKTGCLLIDTSRPQGMIFFSQGRIVHAAAANGILGKDAINSMLALQEGKFRFLLDKTPKVADLNLSTLEVLMEWSKAQDEAHRH
jgi:hypothetical protein